MEPIVLKAGEGETIELAGNKLAFKVEASDTDGGLGLVEYTAVPGLAGPPPHVHRATTDIFYVLEGTLTVRVGDDEHVLGPGAFALVPPGTVHTFSNPGAEPARFLSLHTPGGFEQYFKEVAATLGERPPDPQVMGEIASRYDFKPV